MQATTNNPQQTLFPAPPPMLASTEYAGHPIRVVGTPDAPEWIAADIAAALGIGNVRQVLSRFDDDEKGVTVSDTPGGPQSVATVTEAGMYRLILRSHKPEARQFRRWLLHDVLPSIRRHGTYPPPATAAWGVDALAQWAGRLPTLAGTCCPKSELIPLANVPLIAWLPSPVSTETVYDWHRAGRRGVYLETLRHAGRLWTTEAAVFVFLCRLASPNPRPDVPLTLTVAVGGERAMGVIRAASLGA